MEQAKVVLISARHVLVESDLIEGVPLSGRAVKEPPNGDITRAAGRRRKRDGWWHTRALVNRTQVQGCASSVAYMRCWVGCPVLPTVPSVRAVRAFVVAVPE
jgi:hypothetical protein